MVINGTSSHAMLAVELRRNMLQPNVHAHFIIKTFDMRHVPWGQRGEDMLIEGQYP